MKENGQTYPLGATVFPEGVNFSVYSKNAYGVDLLLFDAADDPMPGRTISFDPRKNRTYHYWHLPVPDVRPGQIYAYRVDGPWDPERGLRFDGEKVLLDPYGRAVVVPRAYDRDAAKRSGDTCAGAMRSVVIDPRPYDWEGDAAQRHPFSRTIIYEMHVAGFTKHPSSNLSPQARGTYAGLIEKIPYLVDLGVTAVELMPVFQFDPQDAPADLANYWGYSPVSFFAPCRGYSSRQDPVGPVDEFRDMVKALHRAGLEVILDVVYNHTAEGGEGGPTFCFRGWENEAYYMLEGDRSRYANHSRTGNTLNANQSIVRRLIIDSLRYWVQAMHVDGFRFDLAALLSRDEAGEPMKNPPVLWDIESDPALAGTKLIAEAWDTAGLYQVGKFIGDNWKEWNGKFRDDVRSFLRAENSTVPKLARRILGSPDLYGKDRREPERSVNFVTCHDGFTLNDLVSHERKHNEANGWENHDGWDDNRSWNCGAEGPTDDPAVEALRVRQIKNFLSVALLSVGTPMILMGDEVRRTQRGNNNAYCQDNEISWFDWSLVERNRDIHRFVRQLVAYRLHRAALLGDRGLTLNQLLRQARIEWHGVKLHQPDWSEDSHSLALAAQSPEGDSWLHVMCNSYWEALEFELPRLPPEGERTWRRLLDTSLPAPEDITDLNDAPVILGLKYRVEPRSIVVLFS